MSKSNSSSFRFHKNKLLSRTKTVELWDATFQGRPHLVKRFLNRKHSARTDFQAQQKILNPIFLRPTFFAANDTLCFAVPAGFLLAPFPEKFCGDSFVLEFLALASALHAKKIYFRWDNENFIYDAASERAYLIGFSKTHVGPSKNPKKEDRRFIIQLRKFTNHLPGSTNAARILKKWERRKDCTVDACLQEMLTGFPRSMERTITRFEWNRSEEWELIAGLYQLAEWKQGRAVLFRCDAGEGKSTLLRQVQETLSSRHAIVIHHQAHASQRSFHSIRQLLDQLFETMGVYRNKTDIPWPLFQFVQGSSEITEEALVPCLFQVLDQLRREVAPVFVFLIDDLHLYDEASQRLLSGILCNIGVVSALFVMTSREEPMGWKEKMTIVPIRCASLSTFQHSYSIPFWKPEQQMSFFEMVYRQTAGNPLLFRNFLEICFSERRSQLQWEDGFWMFPQQDLFQMPSVAKDLCNGFLPDLSTEERAFLELASVQGNEFDPALISTGLNGCSEMLRLLQQKGIVIQEHQGVRFRAPILAESFYGSIPVSDRETVHKRLAEALQKRSHDGNGIVISKHLLRAGDWEGCLESLIHQNGKEVQATMMLLDEMEHPLQAWMSNPNCDFGG